MLVKAAKVEKAWKADWTKPVQKNYRRMEQLPYAGNLILRDISDFMKFVTASLEDDSSRAPFGKRMPPVPDQLSNQMAMRSKRQ